MQRSPINAQMAKTIEQLTETIRTMRIELNQARIDGHIHKLLARKYLQRVKELRAQLKQHTQEGSIECPHCHWGFAPSVIEQHIREKHGT